MIITTGYTLIDYPEGLVCTQSDACRNDAVVAIVCDGEEFGSNWSGLAACADHHPDKVGGVFRDYSNADDEPARDDLDDAIDRIEAFVAAWPEIIGSDTDLIIAVTRLDVELRLSDLLAVLGTVPRSAR